MTTHYQPHLLPGHLNLLRPDPPLGGVEFLRLLVLRIVLTTPLPLAFLLLPRPLPVLVPPTKLFPTTGESL